MNNFISIDGNKLYLHSINRKQPEEIPYNIVVDNLPKFYDYLGSKRQIVRLLLSHLFAYISKIA